MGLDVSRSVGSSRPAYLADIPLSGSFTLVIDYGAYKLPPSLCQRRTYRHPGALDQIAPDEAPPRPCRSRPHGACGPRPSYLGDNSTAAPGTPSTGPTAQQGARGKRREHDLRFQASRGAEAPRVTPQPVQARYPR